MNYFVKVVFFILFLFQISLRAQSEFEVFDNQKEVVLSPEVPLYDINPDGIVVTITEPIGVVDTPSDAAADTGAIEAFNELSTTDLMATDTLDLSQEAVLNAKLVGEREDTERIVAQMIEKEFLKKDKENSFALRHVVLGVMAAFCLGVVAKYVYDAYSCNLDHLNRRLQAVEKNAQEVVILKAKLAETRAIVNREIEVLYERLGLVLTKNQKQAIGSAAFLKRRLFDEVEDKKRELPGGNGSQQVNVVVDNSTTKDSGTDPLSSLAAAAGAGVGIGAKVLSSGCCS